MLTREDGAVLFLEWPTATVECGQLQETKKLSEAERERAATTVLAALNAEEYERIYAESPLG